jgi:uncharacterized membrane protein
MAYENSLTGIQADADHEPDIRSISPSDLKDAVVKGIADFNAMPTHLIFLCLIYPIVTLVAARLYGGYDVLFLVFPALAGFTLVGPLAALGMYELSRRREAGIDTSRWHAFEVIKSPSIGAIALLGLLLTAIYFLWMGAAWAIFHDMTGGVMLDSVDEFISLVFGSEVGRQLIFVGCATGFIFSVVVLTLSVISFPMLLDRKVKLRVAIDTSIRVVLTNPITMGIWGVTVATSLLIGSLPFFFGLAVVMPVLGHATWHLYRSAVVHD